MVHLKSLRPWPFVKNTMIDHTVNLSMRHDKLGLHTTDQNGSGRSSQMDRFLQDARRRYQRTL